MRDRAERHHIVQSESGQVSSVQKTCTHHPDVQWQTKRAQCEPWDGHVAWSYASVHSRWTEPEQGIQLRSLQSSPVYTSPDRHTDHVNVNSYEKASKQYSLKAPANNSINAQCTTISAPKHKYLQPPKLLKVNLSQMSWKIFPQPETPVYTARWPWIWGQCTVWCACLHPSFLWYSLHLPISVLTWISITSLKRRMTLPWDQAGNGHADSNQKLCSSALKP